MSSALEKSGLGLVLVSCLLGAFPVSAADTVLVPPALGSDDWVAKTKTAILRISEGHFRDGIQILQAGLSPGSHRPLEGGESSGAIGERTGDKARLDAAGGGLVQMPPEIPKDLRRLAESLSDGSPAGGQAPSGPEKRALVRRGRVIVPGVPGVFPPGLPGPALPPIAGGTPAMPAAASPPVVGRRYLPVSSLLSAALRAMPPEGLRVYRELYDGAARGLLEDYARHADGFQLRRAASEYFLTSFGDEAAEILGDALFESGDYRSAVSWWRKIILEYPDSDIPRERLQRKIVCSLRILGEEKEYAFERGLFLEAYPGEKAGVLALEAAINSLPREEKDPPERASRWGGELWEARPPSLSAAKLSLSWDSWVWSRLGIDPPSARQALLPRFPQSQQALEYYTLHYPFVPLLDGDALYVSGVFSLFRLDARPGGGAILREYKKPVPLGFNDYLEKSESPLYTTTVWKKAREPRLELSGFSEEILITHYLSDRVKQTRYLGYDITVEIPTRSLVAFDGRSGKILWKSGKDRAGDRAADGPVERAAEPNEALDPDEDDDEPDSLVHRRFGGPGPMGSLAVPGGGPATSSEKDFSYTSPVIVKDGLVVAGGWHQVGYVDCAVRALDLKTGAVRWEALLSSSGLENTMFGELAREPFAGALCEEGGVIYYVTQLGVVAALELRTGRILWLTTYDTIEIHASMSQSAILRDLSWGANPPLILGPALIVTPRDSEYLYAVDRGVGPGGALSAGKILWKYHNPLRYGDSGELRDLVGYLHGLLYFTGKDEISALDLRSMDAHGRLASAEGAPSKLSFRLRQDQAISARGALTAEGVIFSDQLGIRRVGLDLISEESLFPGPFRPSEWGLYPGLVLASGEGVLLVSRHLISSYIPEVGPK